MILDIVIVLSSWFVHREDFSSKARCWCRSWNTSNFETLNVTQPLEAAKLGRDLTTRIVAQSICVRRLRFCGPLIQDTWDCIFFQCVYFITIVTLFYIHCILSLSTSRTHTHWLILCLQASFVKEDGKTFSTSMTHILYAFPLVVGFYGCQLMLTHRN